MRNSVVIRCLFLLLILNQFIDYVLTYTGILRFGSTQVEGNPIIKYLMNSTSIEIGLTGSKIFACLLIWIWYRLYLKRLWKRPIAISFLIVVNCIYALSSALWIIILLCENCYKL
jgi:hypothetical protein